MRSERLTVNNYGVNHQGERYNTMRMYSNGQNEYGPRTVNVYARTINVNNTHLRVYSERCKAFGGKPKYVKHTRKQSSSGRKERPPKLYRFAQSCGMLDQDVVYGMGTGELCAESVKALGYTARGICSDAKGFVSGVVGVTADVAILTCKIATFAIGAFAACCGVDIRK